MLNSFEYNIRTRVMTLCSICIKPSLGFLILIRLFFKFCTDSAHDKTNTLSMHLANIQISLGIHSVCMISLILHVTMDPGFFHADSKY